VRLSCVLSISFAISPPVLHCAGCKTKPGDLADNTACLASYSALSTTLSVCLSVGPSVRPCEVPACWHCSSAAVHQVFCQSASLLFCLSVCVFQEQTDELLAPVLRSYDSRQSQRTMDQFLSFSQRFAKIKVRGLGCRCFVVKSYELVRFRVRKPQAIRPLMLDTCEVQGKKPQAIRPLMLDTCEVQGKASTGLHFELVQSGVLAL
jgi:hypothetical protein